MTSPEHATRMCRACMRSNSDMHGLYDPERGGYREKMAFCTGLQIAESDGLPSYICDPCAVLLNTAHQFKTTCLNTDAALRTMAAAVKLEDTADAVHSYDVEFSEHLSENEDDRILARVKLEPQDDLHKGLEEKGAQRRRKLKNGAERVTRIAMKTDGKMKRRRPLWCEICQIKFLNKQLARKHADDLHRMDQSLICEFCGKLFKHRSSQYYHLRSHMPPMYSCDVCSYSCCSKSDLLKHKRIHSGVKQYQCEFCTAAYHNTSNLRSHIQRTHEGRRDHVCHICSHTFYDRRKLLQHIDSHNDIKRYICNVCGVALSRRNYWARHMMRQHGIRIETPRPGRQKTTYVMGQELANAILSKTYGKRGANAENVTKGEIFGDGETTVKSNSGELSKEIEPAEYKLRDFTTVTDNAKDNAVNFATEHS